MTQLEAPTAWRIVQRQESWHVLDNNGILLVAFPTRAEGQAWVAGVRYGIDKTQAVYRETAEDLRMRMEGAARTVDRARVDTVGVG